VFDWSLITLFASGVRAEFCFSAIFSPQATQYSVTGIAQNRLALWIIALKQKSSQFISFFPLYYASHHYAVAYDHQVYFKYRASF
jgi:hypothetical protein